MYNSDYEPYQEIREFRKTENKFNGFSHNVLFKKMDKKPISDFLNTIYGQVVVSPRIANFLKEKYTKDVDLFPCEVEENNQRMIYYFVRPKYCIDILDRKYTIMVKDIPVEMAFRSVLNDKMPIEHDFFSVLHGERFVISEKLYSDLKLLKPTGFVANECDTTTSVEVLKKKQKIKNSDI